MFTRILSSAVAGLTITAALLYLMHYLIETGEAAIDPRPPVTIDTWGRTIDDSELIVETLPPERVDPAVEPPPLRPPVDPVDEFTPVGFRTALTPAPGPSTRYSGIAAVDGALMTIVTVRPNYPAAASQRGIEGQVIVQFDVTAAGTVSNIVVIESSNRLFNRAAVNAAKRFRFKPKIVDGVPQISYGVQRLFTFEMEKN